MPAPLNIAEAQTSPPHRPVVAEAAGLVSTIITAYNKAPYLAEAIDSALAQDYPHHEILVIDDGSTDGSRAIAESYGDRIRFIHQENRGQSAARNLGIREARGEFIAFLDGDDRWRPGKLTKQMEVLRRDPGVGLVYTDRLVFRGDEVINVAIQDHYRFYRGMVLDQLLSFMLISLSSVLARRDCLIAVGLFDERRRISEDFDLWLRLARAYSFDYVGEILLEYRVGIDSVHSGARDRLGVTAEIQDEFIKKYYDGRYPNRRAVALGTANRYELTASEHLAAGRQLQAFRLYANALRFDPWNPRRARDLVRSLVPNAVVAAIRGARA